MEEEKQIRRRRTYWLDNFRTCLTGLVIYHHTSAAYGGPASGVNYRSSQHPSMSTALLGFNVLNQTYFMGSFFLLSGHFTSISAKKKPPQQILRDRVMRLGVPAIVYSFVAKPIQLAITRYFHHQSPIINGKLIWDGWRDMRGLRGPVWYCGLLLVFDTVYLFSKPAIQRLLGSEKTRKISATLAQSNRARCWFLLSGIFASALSSYFVLTQVPLLYTLPPLSLCLTYLPQYIFYYTLGHLAPSPLNPEFFNPRGLLPTLTATTLLTIASCIQYGGSIDAFLASAGGGKLIPFPASAFYPLFNEQVGFLLFYTVASAFRKWFDFAMPLDLGKYAYAAFLVHMPVSQFVEEALDGWRMGAVAKTAFVGTLNVVASWVAGWFLVKIPKVRDVVG